MSLPGPRFVVTPLTSMSQRDVPAHALCLSLLVKNRGKCSKTSIVSGGRRKIHSSFEVSTRASVGVGEVTCGMHAFRPCVLREQDGSEMVEEYDVKTDDLVVKKFREKGTLGQSLCLCACLCVCRCVCVGVCVCVNMREREEGDGR